MNFLKKLLNKLRNKPVAIDRTKQKPPVDVPGEFKKECQIKHSYIEKAGQDNKDLLILIVTHKPTNTEMQHPGLLFTLLNENQKEWLLYDIYMKVKDVTT